MKNGKLYHNLKELVPIVNLKYRQLKSRVKDVKVKYDDNNTLIYKNSNRWYIHKSIINEFNRKRNLIDFKLFITINPEGDYPPSMLKSLVRHIKNNIVKESPLERIKYVLETDNRNILHIHFLTTYNNQRRIRQIINTHILSQTKLNIHIKKLHSVEVIKHYNKYMEKQNKPILMR